MTNLQLDILESKGLIGLASVDPELEYLFRHALIQDTAYGSLLKQERRVLHRQVAEALEDLYPERRADLAAVLALHFEQAGAPERAIPYLMEAAGYASARNAIVEAFDLFTRADHLLPPVSSDESAETRRLRVVIALGRSRAGVGFLSSDQHLAIIEPGIDDAKRLGDLRLEADITIQGALMLGFAGDQPERRERLTEWLDRAAEIGRQLDDPSIAALPRSLVGLYQVFTGRLREGVATLAATAPLLAEQRDFIGSSFARMALAMGYARLGEFDRADEAIDNAAQLAEEGDLIAKLDTMIGQANIRLLRGDLDGAVPLAIQCTDLAVASGATACVAGSNLILGDAYMQSGRFGDAQIAFEHGTGAAEVINQNFRPSLAAYLRANAARMGDFTPRARTFDEALEEARTRGDGWSEANVLWKRAETEARRADAANTTQVLDDFKSAFEMFDAMRARPIVARVLRDWGETMRRMGRAAEGDEKLRAALKLFDALAITREAGEVRAELGAAATT
jgi:tetratricopeptide (TPR) repeat protein